MFGSHGWWVLRFKFCIDLFATFQLKRIPFPFKQYICLQGTFKIKLGDNKLTCVPLHYFSPLPQTWIILSQILLFQAIIQMLSLDLDTTYLLSFSTRQIWTRSSKVATLALPSCSNAGSAAIPYYLQALHGLDEGSATSILIMLISN